MKKRKLPLIIAFFALCTAVPVAAQSYANAVKDYVKTTSQINKEVSNRDFVIASEDHSESLKATVVQIQQTYEGIPVFGNYSTVLVRDNKVLNFVGDFTNNKASGTNQHNSAANILAKVAQNLQIANPQDYVQRLAEGQMKEPRLVYYDNGQNLILSYELEFEQKNSNHYWLVVADANTGDIYIKQDLTISCNFVDEPLKRYASHNHAEDEFVGPWVNNSKKMVTPFLVNDAQYTVYQFPVEAPTFGARTVAQNPWDLNASPQGWQNDGTTEYTITRGNNAHAYLDLASTNAIGASADGGANHQFNFPLDLNAVYTSYTDAAITNVFYATNKIHDILYNFGFNELSKNFQANNFGKGGAQNDYVLAEARDGSDLADLSLGKFNNANFATPSDGQKPRMQMYLWQGNGPYFMFNSPAPLAGTGIAQIGLGYFGAPLWQTPVTADVAVSPILEACTALPAGSLAGKIGIAKRNNCSFNLKVKNMQDAGAVAAIIYNSPDAATSPGEVVLNMSADATVTGTTIPSVFLVQSQGENIVNLVNGGQTVNVSLKMPVFDGDLDNGVIAHEYGHGLSNRTTGTSVACLNTQVDNEQMGEGWSDFVAYMTTMRPNDTGTTARGIATYVNGEDTNGGGIRLAKYTTDMSVNGYTYGDTNGMTASDGSILVHNIGFVWASILWDLHWKYAEKYGFNHNILADANSGSARAFQMVVNGLKLQGCYPTFPMGRDGILAADQAATGGADKCLIWNVFAKRGVGVNASAGSKTSIVDQVEDFTVPAECITAAVSETGTNKPMTLYPNPARNEFFLDIKGNVLGKIEVEIFDASGKLVANQKVEASSKQAISTQNLPNGVYVVKAKGLGFESSTKLMIKK